MWGPRSAIEVFTLIPAQLTSDAQPSGIDTEENRGQDHEATVNVLHGLTPTAHNVIELIHGGEFEQKFAVATSPCVIQQFGIRHAEAQGSQRRPHDTPACLPRPERPVHPMPVV
jgi:hypothetical protein